MSKSDQMNPAQSIGLKRELGRYGNTSSDSTRLVCFGGIHGNEPAGVLALERVLAYLKTSGLKLKGELIAFSGNRQALQRGQRYLAEDLNRVWTEEILQQVLNKPAALYNVEELELVELYSAIKTITDSCHRIYFLDLHTTSSKSQPFSIFNDTLRNRKFAEAIKAPLILGLEESIDGTLVNFLTERGYESIVFEAGQHDDQDSVNRHETAIWFAMAAAGLLAYNDIPNLAEREKIQQTTIAGIPHIVEIIYCHEIGYEDGFKMYPGFHNFQKVTADICLGSDKNGEIYANADALLFMPLYQGQGNDGFFLVQPVKSIWLKVSSLLRRLHIEPLLHKLPGISQDPDSPDTLIINRHVARWAVLEIFHLLGYKKDIRDNGVVTMRRRKFDIKGPIGL